MLPYPLWSIARCQPFFPEGLVRYYQHKTLKIKLEISRHLNNQDGFNTARFVGVLP